MINNKFDTELLKIDFFKLHPQLIPFVGQEFDKYRILQIGESHYLDQSVEDENFDIMYFKNHWWTDECNELIYQFSCNFNTRGVIDRYMAGIKCRSYNIFTNFVKSFQTAVLEEKSEIYSDDYKYIAFMNFYQMPALYEGQKYWNSILTSAKK